MEITIKDQLGRLIRLPKNPTRIISLVPSQTELLIDLGLEDKIVGITKFCVHPKHLRKTKKIVGGTKKVSFEKIEALEPDIILCNKEENTKELVEFFLYKGFEWVVCFLFAFLINRNLGMEANCEGTHGM